MRTVLIVPHVGPEIVASIAGPLACVVSGETTVRPPTAFDRNVERWLRYLTRRCPDAEVTTLDVPNGSSFRRGEPGCLEMDAVRAEIRRRVEGRAA